MKRFAELMGAERFATGVVTYADHFGDDYVQNTRSVVLARFGQRVFTDAIVDTGALWCILNPQIADQISSQERMWLGDERLYVRGVLYRGSLFRLPITLMADEGDDLTVEATVFVPTFQADEEWVHPNFLGLDGFLHRLRFAVDPAENAFYFGAMAD